MKAVAYIMDTSVWNVYKNEKADYAIGGPTIEMFFASYNKKHGTNYQASATSSIGYQISRDGGESWINHLNNTLNESDSLYIITSQSDAYSYSIASPSASSNERVMCITCVSSATSANFYNESVGYRPVVCLSSNVLVIANDTVV